MRSQIGVAIVMVERLGQPVDAIERQPQGLADVAHGRARAIGDDLGGHAGPVAAVFFVDVLQHFLAAFVLEIDVDVGSLVSLPADESLEEDARCGRDRPR